MFQVTFRFTSFQKTTLFITEYCRKIKPCSSMCFYYFLFDLHLNHLSLDKDHYNFPKDKQVTSHYKNS